MSSKSARVRFNRRERRKAKASNFERGIKRNSKKHGHGPN